ncbi:NAD(P)-dependent oxidoreductase [Fredinandcohnia sp. 179-A 10B2 NHS]|uniref:NAD(P)-dependent oxidoreductase n=1 Tax=Fredinandcohnia sp. 179-A 10B2 NHS TaxID=3235176 RepID=UPI0039A0F194
MKRVGFIGLGSMGLPMAKRLCESGYSVKSAAHVNQQPAQELAKCGGIIKDSFVEVVQDIDVLITILPADQQVEGLLLDEQILSAISPNTILIEMSTCTSETIEKVNRIYADKDIRVIDAPVSGGTTGAEKGTLTIICGGNAALLETIRPVLSVFGSNIYYVGEVGNGKAVKAINQMLLSIHALAASEAFTLAEKLGINHDILYSVITSSSGNSTAFKNKYNNMVKDQYDLGFKFSLMKKDMKIALKEGEDIPLPLLNTSYQLFELLPEQYHNEDFSVINKLLKK